MIAPDIVATASSISFLVGVIISWFFSVIMIANACVRSKWGVVKWPPAVSMSVGIPLWFAATHAILYTVSQLFHLPDVIDRGTWLYEVMPLMVGPAMMILLYLLVTRKLLPSEEQKL